ncbi:MAG TPA: type IX secretion system plug protein domain-containing protein, partial [Chryseosolibacter sp.]
MKSKVLMVLCVLFGCTPLTQLSQTSSGNPKSLQLIDFAYEPQIRTIVIRPAVNDPRAYLDPAVTHLGEWNLLLEFDDLRDHRDTYYARIVHCNYDWTRSELTDLDFLSEFNEFPINTFEFSVDTHIPYAHYQMNLPPVKLPGNYVVVVYRGSDKDDIILSKRFMVFDTRVTFENERNLVGAGNTASLNQQINFTINYTNLDIIDPLGSVKVAIRQNQRWDNIAMDIRPSFVREIEKEIEYRFFEREKMFKGGSEFRFFDLRSLNNPGR